MAGFGSKVEDMMDQNLGFLCGPFDFLWGPFVGLIKMKEIGLKMKWAGFDAGSE